MEAGLKVPGQVKRRLACRQCGDPACFVHLDTFAFAVRKTGTTVQGERVMRGAWVSVCQECDGYLLMQDRAWGIPFYSVLDCAVIAVGDRDGIATADHLPGFDGGEFADQIRPEQQLF